MSNIGILLDNHVYTGIPRGRTGFERLTLYNQAAARLSHSPIYLTLNRINFKKQTVVGYIPDGKGYRHILCQIPSVIHNRAMPFTSTALKKLGLLKKKSLVFNAKTRFNKDQVHHLLQRSPQIKPFLPKTNRFNKQTLDHMIKEFPTLYIKPVNSSVGKGIIMIGRVSPTDWKITTLQKQWHVSQSHLYLSLKKLIGAKSYLIQQGISLAKYNGSPFDLRVSVQRNGEGLWGITGIIGKVARKGRHVTNVAQGGHVVPYEELLTSCQFSVPKVKQAIEDLSLQIAAYLGPRLSVADLGLDVGLDEQGRPYFIEMNGRDLRYSFLKADMVKEWCKTYENPILYADYLLKRK